MTRLRRASIKADLEKKLVFLVGPRQVGKTWLARDLGRDFRNTIYLNFDSRADRTVIEGEAWLPDAELLILDELHKMPDWKSRLKGIWDTRPEGQKILVTGSARLDTFRQAGDSLACRFFKHRLLPLTIAELAHTKNDTSIDRLFERGGFPEPYLAENPIDAERWRSQYLDGLLREDILDFERIHDLRSMRLVLDLLRERVGSPVSSASIARDLGVSPTTVRKYIAILEALFIVFPVSPWSRNIARSLLKEPKIYFFDLGLVKGDEGARFENLVALALLKDCWALADVDAKETGLYYIRTKDGAEIDFCLTLDDQPELLVEAKLSDATPTKTLRQIHENLGTRAIQLVKQLKHESMVSGIELRRAADFLAGLRE